MPHNFTIIEKTTTKTAEISQAPSIIETDASIIETDASIIETDASIIQTK